ncbi:MAG: ATP-binding protein [Candidatus Scalindua rubra]|uniref:ATPase n=1 Tax=Candidatus Scalindua brodae TaxID=237368 RepID=A0A0B0ELF0_9BACT|nr:MAG: ATPase [Candidatus Scalindua brodae]MBZ0108134.1 ATP-binding protein [Candidatus Scalindua rubra]TWU31248.1 ATP-dependent zinc metalloprotease FtsH 3 [Candidatus Brocadiaceae bacterium S225]
MTKETKTDWFEANKRYLMASIAIVREALEHKLKRGEDDAHNKEAPNVSLVEERDQSRNALPGPSTLDTLVATFGLSNFERDILLLCAGVELDSRITNACARYNLDAIHRSPTFNLALATLPDSHWSALTPDAPLRYWRLIEVGAGDSLTSSQLRIDERILNYLNGVTHLDERLHAILYPVEQTCELSPSHMDLVKRFVEIRAGRFYLGDLPVIQLCGIDPQLKKSIAAAGCRQLGLRLYSFALSSLPADAVERSAIIKLWERETALNGGALLFEYDNIESQDNLLKLQVLIRNVRDILIVSTRNPLSFGGRMAINLDVKMPDLSEQITLWNNALGPLASRLNGQLTPIVTQFRLSNSAIRAAGAEVVGAYMKEEKKESSSPDNLNEVLWNACLNQARPNLDDLAQRIHAKAGWDDLVLPDQQKKILFEIVTHLRHQARVYEEWGFAEKSERGLGISTLFSGPSGTGKTMAAEVLANELRLDLYRIDLSSVVSKYIGETEKQLRRVFDAAEQGGALLLFDEADALFGKRSEIKDSHDRYANIEVSYLLQRMEAYRGLAILTTNQKSSLDTAFLRRIRFIIQFPFPDAGQRGEIWQRVFPGKTPTEGLNFQRLSRLNISGGNIRNIALNAAFLAADQGRPVGMDDIKNAAFTEYIKIEKTLSAAETRDW